MNTVNEIKLADLITVDSSGVLKEVKSLLSSFYPSRAFRRIDKSRKMIVRLFNGKFENYRSCNTEYHDLEHTEEAFLAASRLLYGYNLINKGSIMSENTACCLLIAALFHDTGYIQENTEKNGTGAKYTSCHVDRSIAFLSRHYSTFGLKEKDLHLVSLLIKSTEMSLIPSEIGFDSAEELAAGNILATADIIGQMSNRRYLEKLLFLYNEFSEAGIPGYDSEYDLLKKTVGFYEIVKTRLTTMLDNSYRLMNAYFSHIHNIDKNLYIEAIDRNIEYIVRIMNDDSTNFRAKLKRADWVENFKPFETH